MTKMSQLGKMFTYIALHQIKHSSNARAKLAVEYENCTAASKKVIDELINLGVVEIKEVIGIKFVTITRKGAPLVARYLAACADELRAGHFGKYKWSTRSKFHKALLARLG